MTDQESKLLIQEIITKAVEGKAYSFRPILYWSEYLYHRRWVLSTKMIIKTLKQAANNLFKEYCQDVITGISHVTKLLAYQQMLDIIAFYENDLRTVQVMIEDYNRYIGDFGNFIDALLGRMREL